MPRSRAGIALIERPVNQSVEEHGCSAREHHADDNQNQNSQRRPAVRGNNERAERKRQRENCVRKTNQLQKPRYLSSELRSHPLIAACRKTFTEATKKTKVVIGL